MKLRSALLVTVVAGLAASCSSADGLLEVSYPEVDTGYQEWLQSVGNRSAVITIMVPGSDGDEVIAADGSGIMHISESGECQERLEMTYYDTEYNPAQYNVLVRVNGRSYINTWSADKEDFGAYIDTIDPIAPATPLARLNENIIGAAPGLCSLAQLGHVITSDSLNQDTYSIDEAKVREFATASRSHWANTYFSHEAFELEDRETLLGTIPASRLMDEYPIQDGDSVVTSPEGLVITRAPYTVQVEFDGEGEREITLPEGVAPLIPTPEEVLEALNSAK